MWLLTICLHKTNKLYQRKKVIFFPLRLSPFYGINQGPDNTTLQNTGIFQRHFSLLSFSKNFIKTNGTIEKIYQRLSKVCESSPARGNRHIHLPSLEASRIENSWQVWCLLKRLIFLNKASFFLCYSLIMNSNH